ncbi:hypothetical protein [Dubosiella muris]|uniref:Uncharacterized protein n=1 Tax=Dubosiella muris TaxID=3038133 RepID=A0AC61RBX3_9FIRM|nr:hypothetical protein [Dubosiella muris]TGY67303.1 hypothetical protein E5336_00570 [Dubosiella muris]
MAEKQCKCLRDKVDKDSITGYFMQIAHKIHDAKEDDIINDRLFYNMEKHDKEALKKLLTKALKSAEEIVG